MRNLKVIISYNGTNYHGFQIQPNAVTIQGIIEIALLTLLGEKTVITGCSRTDAGVHAREFCFNMKTTSTIPNDGFVRGLNALLPNDVAVHSCEEVDDEFHARYSAKSKEYFYLIYNEKIRDVFMQNLAYFYNRPLNLEIMQQAADLFIGEYDFSAYCKAESLETVKQKKHGAIREIYDIRIVGAGSARPQNCIKIVIHGNGFLHNMVRILSGTLINVSEDKLTLDDVRESLSWENHFDTSRRETAGVTLPSHGLYLNRVFYEE